MCAMSKTKNLSLANQIRSMKSGDRFEVKGKSQRIIVCRTIKTLRDAGVITLDIITRENGTKGKFNVIAL